MGAGAAKDIATKPSLDYKPSSSRDENTTKANTERKAVKPSLTTSTSQTGEKPSFSSRGANITIDTKAAVRNKGNTVGKKVVAQPSSTSVSKATTTSDNDLTTTEQLDELQSGSDIHRPVTAAIDFGTTSSGFAFVFKDKTSDVQINKWVVGASDKEKAPTAVLLKEDKSFHSFGYTAEEEYANLCEKGKQKGWRYFHLFKMDLYRKNKLSRNTKLYDVENKPMPALEILSIVICYLKKKILEAIRLQIPCLCEDEVMYVITVPAIWSDAAKQLMREACTRRKEGIRDDQLRLVLEPEAASVYCSGQRVIKGAGDWDGDYFHTLPVGQTYILCDIGGGTLDMATHEIIADGHLLEKYVARGNDKGGHHFNKKCLEFLEKLFGKSCFREWKTTECGDFLDLERAIEEIKRKVGEREDDIKLKIDLSLLEQYQKSSGGKGIETFESDKNFSHAILSSKKGNLILKSFFLREFIKETAVAIGTYLETIIKNDSSVKLIFLVGGLARSPFVRQYIESRFPRCKVVVPEDPGVAVLKGAVLLGNCPQIISSRLARYTYGIAGAALFIPGTHREEFMITRDGEAKCDHVFVKLIEKGAVLKYGQRFTTTVAVTAKLPETKQLIFTTFLYQSNQTSPMYTEEDDCSKLGGFELHPPKGGWPDQCNLETALIVGEAELKLQVSDDLGRKYETKIDFLLP